MLPSLRKPRVTGNLNRILHLIVMDHPVYRTTLRTRLTAMVSLTMVRKAAALQFHLARGVA
jgi:hypothetical protein